MNDFVPELISLAESRGFEGIARALPKLDAELTIPTQGYPDVDTSPGADIPTLLGQLVRRGLQRPLVEALLQQFDGRPLERALIAWDVLAGAVIPEWEGSYIATLRTAAESAVEILPAPGELGAKTDLAYDAIIRRLWRMAPSLSPDEAADRIAVHDIAAYESVRATALEELRSSGVLTDLRNFSKLLSLAHLPTIASFYARYAQTCLGESAASEDLVEILCDADAGDRLPRELFADDGSPVNALAAYAALRTLISSGAPDTAFGLLGERFGGGRRPRADTLDDRLALVYAELSADIGEANVPPERLARITTSARLWRYALRVVSTVVLRQSSPDSPLPLQSVRTFLTGFGNDYRFWRGVIVRPSMDQPWFGAAIGSLLSETVALPHDRACWRSLEYLLDPEATESEVLARLRVQTRF